MAYPRMRQIDAYPIFALTFTPDGSELYAAGMGSTTDPAAGNGRQLWHR